MDMQNLYKLKSRFVARKVGNESVVVPLVNNVAKMDKLYTLNETAGFLWENLSEGTTEESLVALLLDNFEVGKTVAEKDVRMFLEEVIKLESR